MQCPFCQSYNTILKGFSNPVVCIQHKRRQRFLCKACSKKFSVNSLSVNFRLKKPDMALNSKIFFFFVRGLSNRQIAQALSISEDCVRIRLDRLSKQALLFHARSTQNLSIREAITYDGLENFSGSQYDPNNINHAIGFKSLFIYDFNFAPLNRKGRMSHWQKRRLQEIEALDGRYNPSAIRQASETIFQRLISKADQNNRLELLTDEHFQYKRALRRIGRADRWTQSTISSRACRNFQNILFAVNHTDLMVRQRLAAFARETISFSKTAGRMCQKYALYMVYKNYMCPQFTKKHIRRPRAHLESPAQYVGLTSKLLEFGDVFQEFPMRKHSAKILNVEWRAYFEGKVPRIYQRNKKFLRTNA